MSERFSEKPKSVDHPFRSVGRDDYLLYLRRRFNISRVYYPGCWDDETSFELFAPEQVVYVDYDEKVEKGERRNVMIADMKHSPFKNGVFDAVFFQDAHISEEELEGALEAVKMGGIVIHSSDDCGLKEGMQLYDFENHPDLKKLKLPIQNKYYTAFEKIDPMETE